MKYSNLKLEQVANQCGSTISPVTLGQLLADPRYTLEAIATAAGVPESYFEMLMGHPEPIVYPPLTAHNVGDAE